MWQFAFESGVAPIALFATFATVVISAYAYRAGVERGRRIGYDHGVVQGVEWAEDAYRVVPVHPVCVHGYSPM